MRIRGSLSKQILLAILLASSLVTVVSAVMQVRFEFSQEMGLVERNMKIIEASHLSSVSRALWNLDDAQLRTQLEGILKLPNVTFVEISSSQGKRVSLGDPGKTKILSREFPLIVSRPEGDTGLGTLRVIVNLEEIYGKVCRSIAFILLTQLLWAFVVTVICYFLIRHILTKHLIHIARYLEELDFEHELPDLTLARAGSGIWQEDELDVLARNINRMKAGLVSSYRSLRDFNANLEAKVEEKTQQLYEQSLKLEQSAKMSALGEMAGGVAHEINNPLAAIKSLSSQLQEVLDDEPLDRPVVKGMAAKIEKITDRIAQIVQGMRAFSRDGSKDPFRPVKVGQLIDETLSFCREQFKSGGIQLEIGDIPAEASFEGRATEMSQVIVNLLGNARDAVAGEAEKWIRISFAAQGDWIELRVADSGPGIPAELREKIFRPFFTTKEIGKGTGMGLSISLGIVRGHGGSLSLDPAAKTCFVIRLPIRQKPSAE